MNAADWVVTIPVKPAAVGKSRLFPADRTASPAGSERDALARAIALDTIAAAAAVCPVIVVTADAHLAVAAQALGARVVVETEPAGLDAAVALGAEAAGAAVNRAALLGDLPALRSDDLRWALAAAEGVDRAVVADAEGTGSTLVTAAAGLTWRSAFGDGSLARHRGLGCTVLEVPDASTLRRDVDTPAQLVAAARLGLGARTAAVYAGR